MAVTSSTFLVKYPEFQGAATAQLDAVIAQEAALSLGDMTDDERDRLIELKVADRLARSPLARDLKMVAGDGSTHYSNALRTLVKKVTLHRRFP